ncbi:MAG: hypothetical protein M1825_001011 [Sarcosagium campestre]|nr:MAG: hypothetical protein M1825_001011 [Sarcosagium campestre]
MAPPIPFTTTALTYPLFAADFDPNDHRYLLVGGGGGEGRSGVGNKLTLLDTSSPNRISRAAEVELSREEDSVTSLAVAQSSDAKSLLALAGINSSSADQLANKNEHLRSFAIRRPPQQERNPVSLIEKLESEGEEDRTELTGSISELKRVSLFAPTEGSKKETYQRIIRLSRTTPGERRSQYGAIATGLAPKGEIVVFKFDHRASGPSDAQARIPLDDGVEAADLDLIANSEGTQDVVYCTDYEVFLYQIDGTGSKAKAISKQKSKQKPKQNPQCIYVTPYPDVFLDKQKRNRLRALRFLTPSLIVLVGNTVGRTGAELLLLHYSDDGMGAVVRTRKLHRSLKAAVGLDVALLSDAHSARQQFVIAVAGQDISIALFTVDYEPSRGASKFHHYATLRDVHPLQMTKICFSQFNPPQTTSRSPQYLKLASVSMGNTVSVHKLPLTPTPPAAEKPHYVLSTTSQVPKITLSIILSAILIAVTALVYQALLEIRGGSRPYLHVAEYLPPKVSSWIVHPYVLDIGIAPSLSSSVIPAEVSADGQAVPTMTLTVSARTPGPEEIPTSRLGLRELLRQRLDDSDDNDDNENDGESPGKEKKTTTKKKSKPIVVHVPAETADGKVHAALHEDEDAARAHGKQWDELEHHEKEAWKQRLIDAGEWAVDEGESIFKGVLFGGLGTLVGNVIREL